MARRLVNEKTLELNITHELMNLIGIQIYGLTQQEESMHGGDVIFYPIQGNPIMIQYKATRKGVDGVEGTFKLNNNKRKNQHETLDMISRSQMIDTYYFLPLVITDPFLINNFGHLLSVTEIFEASQFTGQLNWKNTEHKVEIDNNGNFTVHSADYSGTSKEKEGLLSKIKMKIHDSKTVEKEFHVYVQDIVEKIEKQMKKELIVGQCEHTFVFFGKNDETNEVNYFQMPIRLQGLSKRDVYYNSNI